MSASWFLVCNVAEVSSPALLVYPDRVEENIRRAIAIASGPGTKHAGLAFGREQRILPA
jgi:hypothetical protein